MSTQYRVETFDAAALDELGPEQGNEMEQRLNELAVGGWKVTTMTSDDDGYVVILQHTRQTRKRVSTKTAAEQRTIEPV